MLFGLLLLLTLLLWLLLCFWYAVSVFITSLIFDGALPVVFGLLALSSSETFASVRKSRWVSVLPLAMCRSESWGLH